MTVSVYDREYAVHLHAVFSPVVGMGMQLYRTGETWESCWIPFRPALRAWRVSQVNARYLERQLRTTRLVWWRYPSVPYPVLLVSFRFVEAHVLGFGTHPACVNFTVWHSRVLSALMQHGVYAPERGHEPAPGEELDAMETKAHLQEAFDTVFPGLTRYRMVTDADGTRHAEALPPYGMEEDDE